ncbi:MAG: hypothetical protein KIT84_26230 [Labilithrix sp.]|nr:hypothetical protein [Labilithrix sp.]MCW5814554.1 hypothetical protein [Labilithrix sp.]
MAPYAEELAAVRREETEAHGRLTHDLRVAFATCAACARTLPLAIDPIEQPPYASLDALVASATRLAAEIAIELARETCPDCDATLALDHVAYHAYHATLRRDLVVRWRQGRAPELFAWDFARAPTPWTPSAEEAERLVRDAAFRADRMAIEVYLFVNDEEVASFHLGPEPKLAHVVFDGALHLLLNEMIEPGGAALELRIGDVLGIEVAHPEASGRRPAPPPPRGGAAASAGPRFEVTINGGVVATVGNPGGGDLAVELSLHDRDEAVAIALNATGEGARAWALPRLRPGDTAAVTVLGAGPIDEPR